MGGGIVFKLGVGGKMHPCEGALGRSSERPKKDGVKLPKSSIVEAI